MCIRAQQVNWLRDTRARSAGVPITDVDGIVIGIIVFNLIAALLPATGKLVLDEDEVQDNRPKGSLQDPKVNLLQPKKFFGAISRQRDLLR